MLSAARPDGQVFIFCLGCVLARQPAPDKGCQLCCRWSFTLAQSTALISCCSSPLNIFVAFSTARAGRDLRAVSMFRPHTFIPWTSLSAVWSRFSQACNCFGKPLVWPLCLIAQPHQRSMKWANSQHATTRPTAILSSGVPWCKIMRLTASQGVPTMTPADVGAMPVRLPAYLHTMGAHQRYSLFGMDRTRCLDRLSGVV